MAAPTIKVLRHHLRLVAKWQAEADAQEDWKDEQRRHDNR